MQYILTEEEYNALKEGKKPTLNAATPGVSRIKTEIDKLLRISTTPHLTDAEVTELCDQVDEMEERGFVHYVIHTTGRGKTSKFDWYTGNRYWELEYLDRAHTEHIATGWSGIPLKDMEDKGMQPLFYETRAAEYDLGLPTGTIPDDMAHQLELISQAFTPALSTADMSDLAYQIKMMRGKGVENYIIHTFGRNYFPETESNSGDRYWECSGDKIGSGLYGKMRKDFIDEGKEGIFYEHLL